MESYDILCVNPMIDFVSILCHVSTILLFINKGVKINICQTSDWHNCGIFLHLLNGGCM